MAIDPSAEYPGQVATGDAGYPLGKARNEISDGDGTGTPLEALWVMDLWGWQQDLLDRAGIAPSGDPDEVGASDYMDAFDALYPAIGRMNTAESDIDALEARLDIAEPEIDALQAKFPTSTDHAAARYNGTTGTLQDSVVIIDDAGAVSGVSTLTATADLVAGDDVIATDRFLYAAAKTGHIDVALTPQTAGWSGGNGTPLIATSLAAVAVLPFTLPFGVTITAIDVVVDPASSRTGSNRMQAALHVRTTTYSGGASSTGTATTMDAFEPGGSTGQNQIQCTGSYAHADLGATGKLLAVQVTAGTGGSTGDEIWGARVTYTYPGPLT